MYITGDLRNHKEWEQNMGLERAGCAGMLRSFFDRNETHTIGKEKHGYSDVLRRTFEKVECGVKCFLPLHILINCWKYL